MDSGFHGRAAIQLNHKGETLQFSAYVYEVKTLSSGGVMNGYNPILTLYDMPPDVPGSDHLVLLNLFNNPLTPKPSEKTGLYAVRRTLPDTGR